MDQEQRTIIRNKGLAWVSAITLGAGAAGAVGAAAIAVTLPDSTTASRVSSAQAAGTTDESWSDTGSATFSESDSDSDDSDDSDSHSDDSDEHSSTSPSRRQSAGKQQSQSPSPSQSQSQLQRVAPPSNTNNPPAATSGGS